MAAKKPKTRKLWGDGKGKLPHQGPIQRGDHPRHQVARPDTCTTTTTRVTEGTVVVRDDVKKKSIVLRKGKSYVARAKRR